MEERDSPQDEHFKPILSAEREANHINASAVLSVIIEIYARYCFLACGAENATLNSDVIVARDLLNPVCGHDVRTKSPRVAKKHCRCGKNCVRAATAYDFFCR